MQRDAPHFLELALMGALDANPPHLPEVRNAIKRIIQYPQRYTKESYPQVHAAGPAPSLTTIMPGRGSFLTIALRNGLAEAFNELLETKTFDIHPEILFGVDPSGRNLISLAVIKGFPVILEKLLQKAISQPQDSPGYKAWLKTDLFLNTPLHDAAQQTDPRLLEILLAHILKYDKPTNLALLNPANNLHKTPLHLCFENLLWRGNATRLLVQSVALDKDSLQKTLIAIVSSLSISDQLQWLRLLPKKGRQILLDAYHQHLAKNPGDKNIGSVYFQALGAFVGLKSLLYAQHDFNPVIPLRKTIKQPAYCDTKEIYFESELEVAAVRDKTSKQLFAHHMPLYFQKLSLFSEAEVTAFNKKLLDSKKMLALLIDQDKRIISEIKSGIETLINDWRLRAAKTNQRKKIKTTAMCLSPVLSLAAAFTYMVYQRASYHPTYKAFSSSNLTQSYPEHDEHCKVNRFGRLHDPLHSFIQCIDTTADQASFYNSTGGLVVIIVAAALAIFACIIGTISVLMPSNVPYPRISQNEWQLMLQRLEQEIIRPLQFCHDQQLLITKDQIDLLTSLTAALHPETLLSHEAANTFERMLPVLENIRVNIAQQRKPFSSTLLPSSKDAVLVEMDASEEHSDNEAKPLVSGSSEIKPLQSSSV